MSTHLEDQGVIAPAEIGVAVGLPAAEVVSLLTRRQWRPTDVAALKAVATRVRPTIVPLDVDLLRKARAR